MACWIAVTASPIATFGGRLKLSVTEGNWPWWLPAIGATVEGDLADLAQRHLLAAGRGRVNAAQRVRPELEIGLDFENHEILVEPCIDPRRDSLAGRIAEDGSRTDGLMPSCCASGRLTSTFMTRLVLC